MITTLLAATAVLKGDALIDGLQRHAVAFFWEDSNPKTGFTKDRASNAEPFA